MAYKITYNYRVSFKTCEDGEWVNDYVFQEHPADKMAFVRSVLYDAVKYGMRVKGMWVSSSNNPEDFSAVPAEIADYYMEDFTYPASYPLKCDKCPLCVMAQHIKVEERGSEKPVILLVGEAPGASDNTSGLSFAGKDGEFLMECLNTAGIATNSVAFDNVVRCLPLEFVKNKKGKMIVKPGTPDKRDVVECRKHVLQVIDRLNPNVIIPLGGVAANALLPGTKRTITTLRGREWHVNMGTTPCECKGVAPLEGEKPCELCDGKGNAPVQRIVYPTFSPTAALMARHRKSELTGIIVKDFRDAWRIATGELQNLPATTVVNNTLEAAALIKSFTSMQLANQLPKCAYDLETKNLSPFKADSDILGICLSKEKGKGYFIPWNHPDSQVDTDQLLPVVQEFLETVPVVGHNLKFDSVWSRAHLGRFTKVAGDSLVQSWLTRGALRFSHSLKALAFDYLGYPNYEMRLKDALAGYSSKEGTYDKVPLKILGEYGGVDAEATYRLHDKFSPDISKYKLDQIYYMLLLAVQIFSEIEYNGLAVDFKNWEELAEKYPQAMSDSYIQLLVVPSVMQYVMKLWMDIFRQRVIHVSRLKTKKWDHILDEFPEVVEHCENNSVEALCRVVSSSRYAGGYGGEPGEVLDKIAYVYACSRYHTLMEMLQEKHSSPTKIIDYTGFKPTSDVKLRELMFDVYGFEVLKATKTTAKRPLAEQKPSLDDDVLVDYVKSCINNRDNAIRGRMDQSVIDHWSERVNFITPLRRYKKLQKLNSSYIEPIEEFRMVGTNRITCTYNISGIKTGRFSTRDMGLHMIPYDSDIKRLFISRSIDKGGLFVCADYSQAELRVLATLSGDKEFIRVLREGGDLHRYVASRVFNKSENAVTTEERRISKAVTFGIIYGSGYKSIALNMNISEQAAKDIIEGFYRAFPGIRGYIDGTHAEAREHKRVQTKFGFIRWLPGVRSSSKEVVAGEMRRAQNTPIQSIASHITLDSIMTTYLRFKELGLQSNICGFIHDSQEIDTFPGEIEPVIVEAKNIMENVVPGKYDWINVPFTSDFEVGARWGASFGVKTLPGGSKVVAPNVLSASSLAMETYPWAINQMDGDTGRMVEIPGYEAQTGQHEFILEGKYNYLEEFLKVVDRGYRYQCEVLRYFPAEKEGDIATKKNFALDTGGSVMTTFKIRMEPK